MTKLGPDLPQPHEFFEVDTYRYRWPSGALKVELLSGVLLFSGAFDHRDVEIAQRTYPGRRVVLNEGGSIEIHPAGDAPPWAHNQQFLERHKPLGGVR